MFTGDLRAARQGPGDLDYVKSASFVNTASRPEWGAQPGHQNPTHHEIGFKPPKMVSCTR